MKKKELLALEAEQNEIIKRRKRNRAVGKQLKAENERKIYEAAMEQQRLAEAALKASIAAEKLKSDAKKLKTQKGSFASSLRFAIKEQKTAQKQLNR